MRAIRTAPFWTTASVRRALTAVAGSPFSNNPGGSYATGFVVSPDGLHLYGVNTTTTNVSVFDVAASGALTAHSGAPYARGTGSASGVVLIASAATSVAAGSVTATAAATDQFVSLSATVTSPRGPIAGGTVTFTVVGLGSVTSDPVLNGIAQATFRLPAGTAAGTYDIMASYSGTSIFDPSSGSALLTLNPAPVVPPAPAPVVPSPPVSAPLAPPSPPTPPIHYLAIGADVGGSPQVNVYDAATNALVASFYAFSPHFTGGVRVAVADVNDDDVPDIICAAGPSGGPQVIVIDGGRLTQVQSNGEIAGTALLASFNAFAPSFTGGVFLAAGRSSSGQNWITAGAGSGGGPQVVVWTAGAVLAGAASGNAPTPLTSFYAFASDFSGGVHVALGDVNGTGQLDVIAGAGPGGDQVIVVDGTKFSTIPSTGILPSGPCWRASMRSRPASRVACLSLAAPPPASRSI